MVDFRNLKLQLVIIDYCQLASESNWP